MNTEYITVIKDGAGVGRIRKMLPNTMFIGTMGGLKANRSDTNFIYSLLTRFDLGKEYSGSTIPHIYFKDYGNNDYFIPSKKEQKVIGQYFANLDRLITLHQRKDEALSLRKIESGKEKFMISKQRNMINFTVVCVNEFAQMHNIDVKEAFRYLFKFEGIKFIKENYDAEHVLSLDNVMEDVGFLCRKNGGLL